MSRSGKLVPGAETSEASSPPEVLGTLIRDTVNVAARGEQLTKTTGDAILLTQKRVDALASRAPGLIDRRFHVLRGKSASVQVFRLDQDNGARVDLTS
jgi:class 3 adenylate cyclase